MSRVWGEHTNEALRHRVEVRARLFGNVFAVWLSKIKRILCGAGYASSSSFQECDA
jgi:hypothetical protein